MNRRSFLKTIGITYSLTCVPFNVFATKRGNETNGIARECLMEDDVPQTSRMVYERLGERAILGHIESRTQKEMVLDVIEASNSKYFLKGKMDHAVLIPSGEIAFNTEKNMPPFPKEEKSFYRHLSTWPEYKKAQKKRNAIEDKLFVKMLQKIQPHHVAEYRCGRAYGGITEHVIAHPNSKEEWGNTKVLFSSHVEENEFIFLPDPVYLGVIASTLNMCFLSSSNDLDSSSNQGGVFVEQGGMAILNPDNVVRVFVN